MNHKILVLGAGHVGSAIATDLIINGHSVTVIDINSAALKKLSKQSVKIFNNDFTDPSVLEAHLNKVDMVVGAAPGKFGYRVMKEVISRGKNMVDISFCPENYMALDKLAKEKGAVLVADIGVAPGMSNVILGYHNSRMKVTSYKCIVGGLPAKREWPLEYQSAWSPVDVIEEYIRPARFRQNGKIITKPAMSDLQLVNLDPIGTLEEWNSDGLRSLLTTMPHIPDMVEKTLRYPGTTDYLKVLNELGYFSENVLNINDQNIKPVDLTLELLRQNWKRHPGEKEFTIMQVTINGVEENEKVQYVYDLYDVTDPATGMLSMSRTTGFTCSAAVELILKRKYNRKGVSPPEYLGTDNDNFIFLQNYLNERNVSYRCTKNNI